MAIQQMMFALRTPDIQFVAGSGIGGTLSSATSINLPAGLLPGDLVIVASTADATTPAHATGYTAGQQGNTNSTGYQWCYKIMPDPVDTTASGLTSGPALTHLAIAFRNVDQLSPLDVTPPTIATSTAGTPNPPQIGTSTSNTMIVALGFLDDDLVAATATAPSNYTLAATTQSASTGATVMAAYRLRIGGPTTEDPGSFGGGDDSWVAATVALRKAP